KERLPAVDAEDPMADLAAATAEAAAAQAKQARLVFTRNVSVGPVTPDQTGTSVGVAWDRVNQQLVEVSGDTGMISRLDPAIGANLATFP
ncbi:MAG TPA: hypothetical protein VMM13_15700, partial [Euzebya sp.]|nr:hypothetical protein [Euzebya sp.]